jgi:subtilisin family serine protease
MPDRKAKPDPREEPAPEPTSTSGTDTSEVSPAEAVGPVASSPAVTGGDDPPSGPTGTRVEHLVAPTKQYLIAARGAVNQLATAGIDMAAVQQNQNIANALQSGADGIRLVARLRGPQSVAILGAPGIPDAQDTIYLAELSDQRVDEFRRNLGNQAIIAEDVPVELAASSAPSGIMVRDPGLLPIMPLADVVNVSLVVRGNGQALAGANVYLMGSIFLAQGVSDADGRVEITLFGERPDTLRSLYVKPLADFWSLLVPRPALVAGQPNVVDLQPLSAQFPGFPGQQTWGWGQVAMGLDRLDNSFRGGGVKVAVVDSGIQRDHPNLQVAAGRDLVTTNDAWGEDTVGHGTHCAGVIAARDIGSGIRGFAPDVELHAVRIFPGAQISHLVEALNYCIESGIDVVNMSLGIPQLGPEQIELLQGKLRQARAAGVACIVAAGNSAGPVQFPGALPEVLAVAAVGQQGTYPATSYHGSQVYTDAVPAANEIFSAKFTCFGDEVDVAAPGVAVLSTFAPRGYVAMDGTSMAAPHVAGMAALLVGHHPELRGQQRDSGRVDGLFEIIRRSCRRLPFPASDGQRQGAGLPILQSAFTAAPASGGSTPATPPAIPVDRPDLAKDFSMFKGIQPAELEPASHGNLQVALQGLEQLAENLTQQELSTASVDGPKVKRDPRLQTLDLALAAAGISTSTTTATSTSTTG